MVYGLPFFEQRGDESIQLESLILGKTDAGSGFRADELVFLLGGGSRIKMFFQSAVISVPAAIADIRRF